MLHGVSLNCMIQRRGTQCDGVTRRSWDSRNHDREHPRVATIQLLSLADPKSDISRTRVSNALIAMRTDMGVAALKHDRACCITAECGHPSARSMPAGET